MAVDRVIISRSPGETRVALLAGERLTELLVARAGDDSIVGNVYLGRVEAVLKGLDAAFVDIGRDRAGFLALPEARPAGAMGGGDRIGDYLAEGDSVLVQAVRDAAEDKGAKLTTHINIAGVNLVFRPGQPGVTLSRRIAHAERARLEQVAAGLAADDGGFIVRTAAAAAAPEAIVREADGLVAHWTDITDRVGLVEAPHLMAGGPGVAVLALREVGAGIRTVVVDDAETLAEVRAYCRTEIPDLADRIESHKGAEPLFEAAGIEEQIEAALDPVVPLAGGGSLIISQTPALCAIDVNTGGADAGSREETAFAVNLAAAGEAAHQLRLRNISGLVAIDFVPLRDDERKRRVLEALADAVRDDPLGPHVVGYTRLGLVELTRRRHGLSLLEIVAGPWPHAVAAAGKSPMTAALEALRGLARGARKGGSVPVLRASPAVAAALAGPAAEAKREAETALGVAIAVRADQTLPDERWEIVYGDR